MKSTIHPEMSPCKVTCTCGNTFEILSENSTLEVGICSACHPFYTGQQKFVDSAGRVDKFTQRYNMTNDKLQGMSTAREKKRKTAKLERKINPAKARVAPRTDDKAAVKAAAKAAPKDEVKDKPPAAELKSES